MFVFASIFPLFAIRSTFVSRMTVLTFRTVSAPEDVMSPLAFSVSLVLDWPSISILPAVSARAVSVEPPSTPVSKSISSVTLPEPSKVTVDSVMFRPD